MVVTECQAYNISIPHWLFDICGKEFREVKLFPKNTQQDSYRAKSRTEVLIPGFVHLTEKQNTLFKLP